MQHFISMLLNLLNCASNFSIKTSDVEIILNRNKLQSYNKRLIDDLEFRLQKLGQIQSIFWKYKNLKHFRSLQKNI